MPYPICHVYVALQFNKSPLHTLGSIFPDVTHLLLKDKQHLLMKPFIKELEHQKESLDFINGIKTHIALDYYLHARYIYPKAKILAAQFSLHPSTAEGYLEIALDRIIDKQHPEVARIIKRATFSFDIEGYAQHLAKVMNAPQQKVHKAMADAEFIVKFKKPYNLSKLLLKGLVLRKYSRLKVREFKLLKSRMIVARANELIKADYQQELQKALLAVETLRKNPWK